MSSPFLSMRLLAAAVAVLLAPARPLAGGGAEDGACVWPNYQEARPLTVAKVVGRGRGRIRFVKDSREAPSCPPGAAACLAPSYLVAGDAVLVQAGDGPFRCAAYHAPNAPTRDWTFGFLPAAALAPVPPARSDRGLDWIGRWAHPGGEISIADAAEGMLAVHGEQTYPLGEDVQNGVIEAKVKPASAIVFSQDDGDCRVRMSRVADWLMVEDNGGCGGDAVTFLGLYRRE